MTQATLFDSANADAPAGASGGSIPRISVLDPKFREPRTVDEMIPVRRAELAAHENPPCPSSKEHGLCAARAPEGQTYEQLYVGIWFDCQQCRSSVGYYSRELAHYHGRPYTDGSQWWKYAGGDWIAIADDEAAGFFECFAAWQNARHQESILTASQRRRSQRSAKAV